MTEKDLHKLRRQDLLELLLSQSKEVLSLRNQIEQKKANNPNRLRW